jgi:protein O-mannosyl-transferase
LHSRVWQAFFLFLLLAFVYAPALHGGFVWDDASHVPLSPAFYTLAGLGHIWSRPGFTQQYYPLTFTTVWIAHHLWGASTLGYHLLNISFHALNAVLLAALLTALGIPAAIWAACLFAFHPLQVETVAWISEIKNVQSTFFCLLAALCYLRFDRLGFRRFYLLGFLFYLCALFSKSVSGTLPAALLVLLWYRRDLSPRRDGLLLSPWIAAGTALGLYTAGLEKRMIGAWGPEWTFSWSERLRIAGQAFWFYIEKLLWPRRLNFVYPRWDIHAAHPTGWIFVAGAAGLFVWAWMARRAIGKAPFAALALYAITLSPALGFFSFYPMRYSFVADHFQYLAGAALLAFLAGALWRLAERLHFPLATARALAVLACAFCAALSRRHAYAFQSSEALWRDTLSKNPHSFLANMDLANEILPRGDVIEGRARLLDAYRVNPEDVNVQLSYGDFLLRYERDVMGAIDCFQRARRSLRSRPRTHSTDGLLLISDSVLADAFLEAGQYDQAKALYNDEIRSIAAFRSRLFWDTPPELLATLELGVRQRLAQIAETEGNTAEAFLEVTMGLQLSPQNVPLGLQLVRLYSQAGRTEDAKKVYEGLLAGAKRTQ